MSFKVLLRVRHYYSIRWNTNSTSTVGKALFFRGDGHHVAAVSVALFWVDRIGFWDGGQARPLTL